ncbi:MAG: hypothetical protein DRP78_01225 [Candidatus Omnitrophota bacterium]|nr:MAG: hypothetical protein DRP78_01225 [Candidatus Omnitrophota bacterium]
MKIADLARKLEISEQKILEIVKEIGLGEKIAEDELDNASIGSLVEHIDKLTDVVKPKQAKKSREKRKSINSKNKKEKSNIKPEVADTGSDDAAKEDVSKSSDSAAVQDNAQINTAQPEQTQEDVIEEKAQEDSKDIETSKENGEIVTEDVQPEVADTGSDDAAKEDVSKSSDSAASKDNAQINAAQIEPTQVDASVDAKEQVKDNPAENKNQKVKKEKKKMPPKKVKTRQQEAVPALFSILFFAQAALVFIVIIFSVFVLLRTKPQPMPEEISVMETSAVKTAQLNLKDAKKHIDLIWEMDRTGFYKSAFALCSHFKENFSEAEFLEDVCFKEADILFKWKKEPPSTQYQAAIKSFQQAIEDYPYSDKVPWAMLMIGKSYICMHLYDQALDILKELDTKYPDYENMAMVTQAKARIYFELKKYAQAIAEYTSIIAGSADSSFKNEAYLQIAVCFEKSGQDTQAIIAYERFIQRFPFDAKKDDAYFAIANIYFARAEYAKALDGFKRTIGKYPYDTHNAQALFMVGECFAKQGDFVQARKIMQEVAYNYHEPELSAKALLKIGDYYYAEQNIDKTIEFYAFGLQRYPDYPDFASMTLFLGKLYFDTKQYTQAIKVLTDLVQKFPHAQDNDEVYLLLGKIYSKDGKPVAAVDALKNIITDYPASMLLEQAYCALANAYFSAEIYDKALDEYMRILNNYPQNKNKGLLYYRLGVCSYRLQLYAEAISFFNEGMNKCPLSEYRYESRLFIARSFIAEGYQDKAVMHLQRLVNNDYLKGDDVYLKACFILADIYVNKIKPDDAINLFDKIIASTRDAKLLTRAFKLKAEVYLSVQEYKWAVDVYKSGIDAFQKIDSQSVDFMKSQIANFCADIGDIFFKQDKFNEALIYYLKANGNVTDNQKNIWLLYQLANVYSALGNKEQLSQFYTRLKTEYPDNYWTKQMEWNLKHKEWKASVDAKES